MKLNLETKTKEQEHIKAYLEENASEILADKINNGVFIEKDGKKLRNIKNLDGFMKYATEEARKLVSKGTNSACIEDKVVYGWAIHYFEEDAIEGDLLDENGEIYSIKPKPVPVKKIELPKPQPKPQMSLFDFMTEDKQEGNNKNDEPSKEDFEEAMKELNKVKEEKSVSPIWKQYREVQEKYPDSIIIYRLGDFYEVFGENAVTLANELNLTLTGRDCGLENRVPMIGFPCYAAENYIRKIVQKHKVAIAETKDDIRLLPDINGEVFDNFAEKEMQEFDSNIEEHVIEENTEYNSETLERIKAIFGDVIIMR